VLRQLLFAADQNGNARHEVGERGYLFPPLGGCPAFEPAITSTADTIFIANTVAPGLGCDERAVRLWSVSAKEGFQPKTILDNLPGEDRASVAIQPDGRVAVATAKEGTVSDPRYTIRVFRAGVDSASKPGFTWNTSATGPLLVFISPPEFRPLIEAAENSDWILSYRYMSTYTDLRLRESMTALKIPESATEPGITIGIEGKPIPKSARLRLKEFEINLVGNVVEIKNRLTGLSTSSSITPGDEYPAGAAFATNGDLFWIDSINPVGIRIARKRWLLGQYGSTMYWDARLPTRVGLIARLMPKENGDATLFAYRTIRGVSQNIDEYDPWRVVRLQLDDNTASQYAADPVVEFFNSDLGHYFITGSANEVINISYGGAGSGWTQTDLSFFAFVKSPPSNAQPVCRFYGQPPAGPNSHFYTSDMTECEAVKKDPGWKYEGIAFYAIPPKNGLCPLATEPVWRAYNNGYSRNDSNHRYSTDRAVLVALKGWTLEGVVFCSPN
jgi:hypothetical protein